MHFTGANISLLDAIVEDPPRISTKYQILPTLLVEIQDSQYVANKGYFAEVKRPPVVKKSFDTIKYFTVLHPDKGFTPNPKLELIRVYYLLSKLYFRVKEYLTPSSYRRPC